MTDKLAVSISDEELVYKIEALEDRQVLVLTKEAQTVIDGLTANWPPESAAWKCKGKANAAFALCTKKIVDSTGCAIVVAHGDSYCSKPCRD
jgi:hypothetical protein